MHIYMCMSMYVYLHACMYKHALCSAKTFVLRHAFFTCVTRLIHTCDKTHPSVQGVEDS